MRGTIQDYFIDIHHELNADRSLYENDYSDYTDDVELGQCHLYGIMYKEEVPVKSGYEDYTVYYIDDDRYSESDLISIISEDIINKWLVYDVLYYDSDSGFEVIDRYFFNKYVENRFSAEVLNIQEIWYLSSSVFLFYNDAKAYLDDNEYYHDRDPRIVPIAFYDRGLLNIIKDTDFSNIR